MNSKVMEVSSFCNSNIEEFQQAIHKLEKENSELQYELKRSEQQMERERQKSIKFER